MTDHPIGIALLGAGRMARVHAKTIGAVGARLVTVFDVVKEAAASLASDNGALVAHTIEEALHHPDVGAVVIVSSSNTHVDCIIEAVGSGKAVMCEKPLAPTLSDAQRCIDASGARASSVFLAFNRRFDPGHSALKKTIDTGEIGDLEQLTITSRDPHPPPLGYIPSSGGIVNILSMSAYCGQSYLTPYSASKGALATLTKNVANAFASRHIRCNGILAGWMDTPGENVTQQKFHGVGKEWLAKAETAQPMGQLVKPDQLAGLAAYILSPESGVVTGALVDYDQRVAGAYPE